MPYVGDIMVKGKGLSKCLEAWISKGWNSAHWILGLKGLDQRF